MYSLGSYSAPPTRGERDPHPPKESGEGFYYAPTAPAFGPPSTVSPHYGFRRNGSSRSTPDQSRNGRKQGSSESRRQAREDAAEGTARSGSNVSPVSGEVGSSGNDFDQGRGVVPNNNSSGTTDPQRSSSAPPSSSRPSAWRGGGVPAPNGDYGLAANVPRRKAGDTPASPGRDAEAARTGLIVSHEQSDRFQALMDGSPFGHRQAQAKVLELIQFWLSSSETGAQIEGAIRAVMVESEESKAAMGQVVQAWGGNSPVSKSEKDLLEEREKKRSQQKPRTSLEPQVIELEDGSPLAPKGTNKADKPRRKSDSSISTASSSSGRYTIVKTPAAVAEAEEAGPANAPVTPPVTTPPPPVADASGGQGATTSPHAPLADQLPPSDRASAGPPSASFRRRYDKSEEPKAEQRPSQDERAKEAPPSSEKRRKEHKPVPPPSDAAEADRQQRSQDVSQPPDAIPSRAATPSSVRPQSGTGPRKTTPATQPASFEQIPRFYFPLGQTTLRQEIINGPLSKKIENPHLKMVDGVALTTTILDDERDRNTTALQTSLLDEPRHAAPNSKSCLLTTLRCVEDCHVGPYIQREFSRLPAAPKFDVKSRVRSGGRFRGSNGTPLAKQEAAYRQSLVTCTQRICVQGFGLPRYFGFIIIRLIQREIVETISQNSSFRASRNSPTPPQHMGTDTSSKAEMAATTLITAQHLKDFYTAHLRGKDSRRRVFDVLLLSASLPRAEDSSTVAHGALDTSKDRHFLVAADFVAYLEGLLQHHPGLSFLRETPDFQSKYVETVVYRIFYEVDRFDRGYITFAEFSNSRLMDAFRQVDATDDINTVLLFFSYEHFYVLYCRFWELNETRNMQLSKEDLARYAPEDTMNPVIINRVFAGIGRPVRCPIKDRIGYEDFVWFCLSEEDKSTTTAIRYWFRVLDTDGDGVLSLYELQSFYDATRDKIAEYVVDNVIGFHDVVCQVFDMLRVPLYRPLTLKDFLREPEAAHVALSMLTNVVKFLQFEQRDPFVAHQDRLLGGLEQSRWDRFARIEYDRMAQEADE